MGIQSTDCSGASLLGQLPGHACHLEVLSTQQLFPRTHTYQSLSQQDINLTIISLSRALAHLQRWGGRASTCWRVCISVAGFSVCPSAHSNAACNPKCPRVLRIGAASSPPGTKIHLLIHFSVPSPLALRPYLTPMKISLCGHPLSLSSDDDESKKTQS